MADFFNRTMIASNLGVSTEGPVIGASVNTDKNFAFVEVGPLSRQGNAILACMLLMLSSFSAP